MQESKQRFVISGVCCSTEETVLRKSLDGTIGGDAYRFNPVTCELAVSGGVSRERIVQSVRQAGFDAREMQYRPADAGFWQRHAAALWTGIAGALTVAGILVERAGAEAGFSRVILLAAILAGGWKIFLKAARAIGLRALDMNVLMTVATIGALGIDKWDEAAAVIVLFSAALMLESYSAARTRSAVQSLMERSTQQALVLRNGKELPVDAGNVKPGELIAIRPGERIPLDGEVVQGDSQVNEAAITGESIAVPKSAGSSVYAGTMNERGTLTVQVTHRFEDTRLAKIVHLVEEAQHNRAGVQNFVDTFATKYTPAVLVTAVLIAVVPPLFFHAEVTPWLYRALVLLVISCPCALVISTPVTIVGAVTHAARHGMLVKGGKHLETLNRVRAIAFDKTGTLTQGRPRVTDVVPLDALPTGRLVHLVAALERRSEHHVADAILAEAARTSASDTEIAIEDFEALPGLGVKGTIEGRTYFLGNHQLCEQQGYCNPEVEQIVERLTREGKTAIVLGRENDPLGIIALRDTVRQESRKAIEEIRELGIRHMVLLSGDHDHAVRELAREVGLTDTEADLMPEDKVAAVRRMQEHYGTVAMVGDGINDAPALAASSVGIAMGVSGTDTALDTADVVLMTDDLSRLPHLLRLSRRTMTLVKQNIVVALLVKLCFLTLGVSGFATLWMAVLADDGAALAVILNGLRILSFRDRTR